MTGWKLCLCFLVFCVCRASGYFKVISDQVSVVKLRSPDGDKIVSQHQISFSCGDSNLVDGFDSQELEIDTDSGPATLIITCYPPEFRYITHMTHYVYRHHTTHTTKMCFQQQTVRYNISDDVFSVNTDALFGTMGAKRSRGPSSSYDLFSNTQARPLDSNSTSMAMANQTLSHQRSLKQFGIGLAAGVAGYFVGGYLCDHLSFLSSVCPSTDLSAMQGMFSALSTQVSDLQVGFTDIQACLTNDAAFQTNTNTEIGKILSITDRQTVLNQLYQGELADLSASMQNQYMVNLEIEATINKGFTFFAAQLRAIGSAIQQEWNATKSGFDKIDANMNATNQRIEQINAAVDKLNMVVFNVISSRQQIREVTRSFWKQVDDTGLDANAPNIFLNDLGQRPMSLEDRASLKYFDKALNLGSVTIQYTMRMSGVDTAYNDRMSIICDHETWLNRTVPGATTLFQVLRNLLGPPPVNGLECIGNVNDPWTCQCAIVVETSRCDIPFNGNVFPFDWPMATDLLDGPGYAGHCSSPPIRNVIDRIARGSNDAPLIFTQTSDWYSWIYDKCRSSVNWRLDSGSTYKVRVFASYSTGFRNLTMDTLNNGVLDLCTPLITEYATYMGVPKREQLLFSIYTLWQFALVRFSTESYTEAEARIFGVIPSGLTVESAPLNDHPREDGSIGVDCLYTYYNQVSDQKMGVYFLTPDTVLERVTMELKYPGQDPVTLYDGTTHNSSLNGQSSISIDHPAFNANVTVVTSTSLSMEYQNLLPGSDEYAVGGFPFDDPISGHQVVVDFPPNAFTLNAAQNAPYSLSYLSERPTWFAFSDPYNQSSPLYPVNETTPPSQNTWVLNNQAFFKATQTSTSLLSYIRVAEPDSVDGVVRCSDSLDVSTGGSTTIPAGSSHAWCNRLQKFRIHFDPTTNLLTMTPFKFSYLATATVPKGNIQYLVVTACPSFYQVVYQNNGDIRVSMNTTNSAVTNVQVKITSDNTDTSPGVQQTCNFVEDKQYSSSRSLEVLIEYGKALVCGPQGFYVNVYQFKAGDQGVDSQPCWPGRGIHLVANYTPPIDPGQDPSNTFSVQILTSDLYSQLAGVVINLWRVQSLLLDAVIAGSFNSQSETDSLNSAIDAINESTQQFIDSLNNSAMAQQLASQLAAMQGLAADLAAKSNQSGVVLGQMSQDIQDLRSQLAYSTNITDQFNASLAEFNDFKAKFDIDSNNLKEQIAIVQKWIDDHQAPSSTCFLSIIPVLGDLVCDELNKITGAVGSVIRAIVLFASILLAVVVGYKIWGWTGGCFGCCGLEKMLDSYKAKRQSNKQYEIAVQSAEETRPLLKR